MSAFSDTQGHDPARSAERHVLRDSFWGQTPAAVLAIAAVVAIVFVNSPQRQRSAESAEPRAARVTAPAAVSTPVPAKAAAPATKGDCADCATVLSIQQLQGTGDSGFAVEVKMADGTRRTVRHFAAGFEPGDDVLVNGNALTLRR